MAKHREQPEEDWDYKVEDGTRTLIRAEEIKQDKKLYAECLKEMEKQHSALMRAMGENRGKSLMAAMGKNKQPVDYATLYD